MRRQSYLRNPLNIQIPEPPSLTAKRRSSSGSAAIRGVLSHNGLYSPFASARVLKENNTPSVSSSTSSASSLHGLRPTIDYFSLSQSSNSHSSKRDGSRSNRGSPHVRRSSVAQKYCPITPDAHRRVLPWLSEGEAESENNNENIKDPLKILDTIPIQKHSSSDSSQPAMQFATPSRQPLGNSQPGSDPPLTSVLVEPRYIDDKRGSSSPPTRDQSE